MQTICTSLQTDNHTNTSSLKFYRPDALPGAQPTVSKHCRQFYSHNYNRLQFCSGMNSAIYRVWAGADWSVDKFMICCGTINNSTTCYTWAIYSYITLAGDETTQHEANTSAIWAQLLLLQIKSTARWTKSKTYSTQCTNDLEWPGRLHLPYWHLLSPTFSEIQQVLSMTCLNINW